MTDQKPYPVTPLRNWIKLTVVYLLIPFALFISGGDIKWWQAWVFSFIILAAGLGGRILAERRHPGLMAERQNIESLDKAKRWDKVLAPLMALAIGFPLVIVAGLDHRFGWTKDFSTWLNWVGILIIACGYAFAVWALVENRFFSGVVRIQTDRDHSVCQTGPYRLIRHPGYSGNLLPLFGIVLGLNSVWTLIPALIALIIILLRTALEDKTLREELPGYREYAQKVRYRLLPGIW